jgi:uncharacterized protein with NAD-binding domain and iron-sulfur cluster
LKSPPVKDFYSLVFAYPQGVSSHPGSIAAGTALLGALLVCLGYKGSVMYRFRSGTAETIIDPIFEVLKARGVKFKFFHKVTEVHYSEGKEIEEISVEKQVRLQDGMDAYQPVRNIKGQNCWPSHPFWRWEELAKQIHPEDLERLTRKKINLESAWADWEAPEPLKLEKGKDFDQVVLGISLGGVKEICEEIIQHKAETWKPMVDNVQTVQTQGVQLWFRKDLPGLGMDLPKIGLKKGDHPILDTYVDPINSYSDMTELLEWESWPEGNPAESIAYFCGPMKEEDPIPPYSDHEFPKRQHERVKDMALAWLNKHAGFLFPHAMDPDNPDQLNLDLLVDPLNQSGASGKDKFDRQFFRANIDPSERYVLSVPKSSQYRLKTDQSGYDNLFFTGDWIDNGYNMGCVECAVMSGLEAAHAVRKANGLHENRPVIRDL